MCGKEARPSTFERRPHLYSSANFYPPPVESRDIAQVEIQGHNRDHSDGGLLHVSSDYRFDSSWNDLGEQQLYPSAGLLPLLALQAGEDPEV